MGCFWDSAVIFSAAGELFPRGEPVCPGRNCLRISRLFLREPRQGMPEGRGKKRSISGSASRVGRAIGLSYTHFEVLVLPGLASFFVKGEDDPVPEQGQVGVEDTEA